MAANRESTSSAEVGSVPRFRSLCVAGVLLVALGAGFGAHGSTLTPCQPATGTAVDSAVRAACQTASPVIQLLCSVRNPVCQIRASAPAAGPRSPSMSESIDCAFLPIGVDGHRVPNPICLVLAVLCPHCTVTGATLTGGEYILTFSSRPDVQLETSDLSCTGGGPFGCGFCFVLQRALSRVGVRVLCPE